MHILTLTALLGLATFAPAQSLTTLYASNNANADGGVVFFDVTVLAPGGITVTELDLNLSAVPGTPVAIEVYTRPGTAIGFEINPAGWTLAATGNDFTAGPDVPTFVDITDFVLAPGLHGIGVRAIGSGQRYTNGNGGNQNYANAQLALMAGSSTNDAFIPEITFNPRVWNGTIHYVAKPIHRDRTPGSVLFYPVHRSGPTWFTIVCVTNTERTPANPMSFGGSTNVHFEYVNVTPNPADPFKPLGCTIFDRIETLTPADTLCVLTTCHNAFAPGGQEGYVVVSAENPASPPGTAWQHDHLIGSELVLNATGIAYAVNAVPFAACTRLPAVAPAPLLFDGVNYSPLPDVLYIDSFIALAGSSLSLTNFTGGPLDCNSVLFSVWNDAEFPLSATIEFSCWFDQPLARVSPLFTQGFLQGTANDPSELDLTCDGVGDLETGWAAIQSRGVRTRGGQAVAADGAMLGAITAGLAPGIDGGRLLWHNGVRQLNGAFRTP